MVRQAQKEGQAKASSPEVARVASRIKKSDAKDFASTKHKGLPEKKKMNEEGYDHLRDQGRIPPTKGKKDATTMPRSYKPSSPRKGKSALEIVKKSITDKYGKGAIMNLKKEGTAYGIYKGDGKMKIGAKKKEDKNKQEVKAVPADTMEGMYDIDPKTGKSPVASSVEKGNKKTGDKRLRHFAKLAKKMVGEAKVDKGRSDYGKASIRNYRRMGPGHGDPGMFDPSGKRGKTIDKRREEHKARRGVKGAKVPAYKVESAAGYSIGGEIKKGVKRHKDAVKKKKERSGKAVPYAMLAQEYVPEEGYDHWRDKQLEKGTWKEPERKNPPRKPMTKKELDKQAKNSQKALDIVKGNIRKKYGKGAIMGEENLSELKNSTLLSYSQKATNDLAFKGDGKKKARKRATGIKTATNKLAMRATDPDGSLGYNKNPKNEEVQVEAKVDLKTPEHKRATVRDKRYGNPHGSHELGGGIRKDRRADHEARRGVKKENIHKELIGNAQRKHKEVKSKKYKDFMKNAADAKKTAQGVKAVRGGKWGYLKGGKFKPI